MTEIHLKNNLATYDTTATAAKQAERESASQSIHFARDRKINRPTKTQEQSSGPTKTHVQFSWPTRSKQNSAEPQKSTADETAVQMTGIVVEYS